ncbi:MAG: glycosyltransferase [Synergistaceae bacterium]|jgi:glycosyltransferase involved in cell wall biosynthesis|nr:glycosyltransferase [Synergistaceae bacterium]
MSGSECNTPLVSFIIPVYNVAPWLRECLDSVLSQPGPSREIVLVDDGSTDGSAAICDEYARRGACVSVLHQENRGQSDARNTAILRASGAYLFFLDGDEGTVVPDMLAEGSLTEVENALASGPDVLYCNFVYFPEVPNLPQSMPDGGAMKSSDQGHVREYLLTHRFYGYASPCRKVVRREFLLENEIFFLAGVRCAEDTEWTARLLWLAQSFAYIERPIYLHWHRSFRSVYNPYLSVCLFFLLFLCAALLTFPSPRGMLSPSSGVAPTCTELGRVRFGRLGDASAFFHIVTNNSFPRPSCTSSMTT